MRTVFIPRHEKASLECHEEATRRGYKDWWDWYKTEERAEIVSRHSPSMDFAYKVAGKYRYVK